MEWGRVMAFLTYERVPFPTVLFLPSLIFQKKNPFFHDMEFKLTINYTGLI